jgi:hypothetical protein
LPSSLSLLQAISTAPGLYLLVLGSSSLPSLSALCSSEQHHGSLFQSSGPVLQDHLCSFLAISAQAPSLLLAISDISAPRIISYFAIISAPGLLGSSFSPSSLLPQNASLLKTSEGDHLYLLADHLSFLETFIVLFLLKIPVGNFVFGCKFIFSHKTKLPVGFRGKLFNYTFLFTPSFPLLFFFPFLFYMR